MDSTKIIATAAGIILSAILAVAGWGLSTYLDGLESRVAHLEELREKGTERVRVFLREYERKESEDESVNTDVADLARRIRRLELQAAALHGYKQQGIQ